MLRLLRLLPPRLPVLLMRVDDSRRARLQMAPSPPYSARAASRPPCQLPMGPYVPPLPSHPPHVQPRTSEERIAAATRFIEQYGFQVSSRPACAGPTCCPAVVGPHGTAPLAAPAPGPVEHAGLVVAGALVRAPWALLSPLISRLLRPRSPQPPMLVDPIDNPFDAAFAPWPLRFYILHRGRIVYKAQVCEGVMGGQVGVLERGG